MAALPVMTTAVHPLAKPFLATGEAAQTLRRYEAIRGEPDSADRREAYAALERLVRRHGAVRAFGVTYEWGRGGEVRRHAPRKPAPPLVPYTETAPCRLPGVRTVSDSYGEWR